MTLEDLVQNWTKGHTKAALQEVLGCSNVTLNNKLAGRTELLFSEAISLAKALDVPLSVVAEAFEKTWGSNG